MRIDNAGVHTDAQRAELATADYACVIAVNPTAVFAIARAAYPHLVCVGGGLIVNLGPDRVDGSEVA